MTTTSRDSHLFRLIACVLVLALAPLKIGRSDTITMRASDGDRQFVIEGTVVAYGTTTIAIERVADRPQNYPAARVIKVETNWPEACVTGRQQLAAGEYQAAAENLTIAAREETRPWARDTIGVELVRAYAAGGLWPRAVDTWSALVRTSGESRATLEPPLAWYPTNPIAASKLNGWSAANDPQMQLIAASFTLQTRNRQLAVDKLATLAKHPTPKIARQATAQLWRARLGQATAAEVDRWQELARQWGDEIGGGPWVVIAEARAQLNDHDAAMLAAMRPAILEPTGSPLAARGLLLAARSAAKQNQTTTARRLAGELLQKYKESPQVAEAKNYAAATNN